MISFRKVLAVLVLPLALPALGRAEEDPLRRQAFLGAALVPPSSGKPGAEVVRVRPETAAEATAIFALIDPLDTSPYFWAGISDANQDGQWVTVTGQPFTNLNWGSNDPDQRTGEIYAIVFSDATFYDWFDDGLQEYACECPP